MSKPTHWGETLRPLALLSLTCLLNSACAQTPGDDTEPDEEEPATLEENVSLPVDEGFSGAHLRYFEYLDWPDERPDVNTVPEVREEALGQRDMILLSFWEGMTREEYTYVAA